MLSPATNSKLAKGLRRLALDQREGKAPMPGEVTREDIARRSGLSERTIRNIELMFAARLADALIKDPNTPVRIAISAAAVLKQL